MTKRNPRLGVVIGAATALTMSGAAACGDTFGEDCHSSHTCAAAEGAAGGVPSTETGGTKANTGGAGDLGGTEANAGAGAANSAGGTVGGAAGSSAGGTAPETGGQGGEPTIVGTPCTKDADCDDADSCTGIEKCVDKLCAAGTAVACPAGLVCAAAKNDACVFATAAPWIVYAADADTQGVNDVYGVKADLLGTMTPVKLSPTLDPGWHVYSNVHAWSPDGTGGIITTTDTAETHFESYLVRFGDGLPAAAVQLTKGMAASTLSDVEWSPTGKSLLINRSDGLHVVDIATDGSVTQARVTPDGYDQVAGWVKNDNEVVYIARNAISTKKSIALAVRSGGSWTRHPLVADLGGTLYTSLISPDRSLLGYITTDGQSLGTIWTLETADGSTPTKVAGPAGQVWMYPSPDVSRYVLATTDKVTLKTTVFGGALSTVSAPPVLQQNLTIGATGALGITPEGPWSPDSSHAAVFQDGTYGKQLVMYQPGAAEEWHALTETQSLQTDTLLWSPGSKALAISNRTSDTSAVLLTLVAVPGYAKRDLKSIPTGGFYTIGPFSAGDEFLVFSTGNSGYYVDLRKGVAAAPDPVAIAGTVSGREFSSKGTDFVYIRGAQNCDYIDFSGAAPAEPVQVNSAGSVTACGIQKLPK